MATRTALSTRTLLVCAAIGVATGILGGIAGAITLGVLALAWGLAFVALALVVRRAAKETRSLAQEA